MEGSMKKLAVYILVPSLIVGSCGAGVYVYQKNKQANTYVKVVPVSKADRQNTVSRFMNLSLFVNLGCKDIYKRVIWQ